MRQHLFRFICVIMFLILLNASDGFLSSQTDPLKELDAYIQKAMKEWEVPGLAVSIVKDDKIIFAKGYGTKKIGKNDPVNEHTLFAIGSNKRRSPSQPLSILT